MNQRLRYAIAGDHAGFSMKNEVAKFLATHGVDAIDCGTHSPDSCDFPDFAEAVKTSKNTRKRKEEKEEKE